MFIVAVDNYRVLMFVCVWVCVSDCSYGRHHVGLSFRFFFLVFNWSKLMFVSMLHNKENIINIQNSIVTCYLSSAEGKVSPDVSLCISCIHVTGLNYSVSVFVAVNLNE